MPKSMGMEKITAPAPGCCPVCATIHDKQDPHDPSSLYYQNQFYKAHKRFPSWADAMVHCSAETRAKWAEELRNAGILVDFPFDQPEKDKG